MSCAPSSVISQSSACRAKPFILKCDFTLGVIIFTSATLQGNALYCALLDLLTSMHKVRLDAVSIATPCIGFQSIKVLMFACKLQIVIYLMQLAIAIACMNG